MTEKRNIYDWCNNCNGPVSSHKAQVCLSCIRQALTNADIKLEQPEHFNSKE